MKYGASGFESHLTPAPVPLPCHSWQSRPVSSGHPRTTPQRPRPVPFSIGGGDDPSRSGFGSRGSLMSPRPSIQRQLRDTGANGGINS
jgi:hypothetical protein